MTRATLWRAWLPFVLTASAYAFFSALLARDGHSPSVALLPIPKESYYSVQAAFVAPVFGLGCVAACVVARFALSLTTSALTLREVVVALFPALTLPTLLLFVLPELAVYLLHGFDALKTAVRFTSAATGLATLFALAMALRKRFILTWTRAGWIALLTLLAQALVASPFLR